ncbi:MAG: hypothetical protein Kow0069_38530 [Promethearchaeota archaeon]
MYRQGKPTRNSPGLLALLLRLTRKREAALLAVPLPFLVGMASVLLYSWDLHDPRPYYWPLFWRDTGTFGLILVAGVASLLPFRSRAKFFTGPIVVLLNAYILFFFALCYEGGHFLLVFFDNPAILEVMFLLGAILSYVIAFVVYFSFTTVGRPWYVLLALVQPGVGISLYSLYTQQVTLAFLVRTATFFCASAVFFAVPYSLGMFSVSNAYRRATGTGGYNFVRAFVLALLTDDQDDLVEDFFDQVGTGGSAKLETLAFRSTSTGRLKGVFVVPHVHFGPFKTAGSATLAERVYGTFPDLPGLTVFHTAVTHAQNLTRKAQVERILDELEGHFDSLEFQPGVSTKFVRARVGKAKALGAWLAGRPLAIVTRHPFPSDDVEPAVLENVVKAANAAGLGGATFVDAHNAIVGDEIVVRGHTPAGDEVAGACQKLLGELASAVEGGATFPLEYGVAKDPMDEYDYVDGVGAGGLVVHVFKVGDQKVALVHVDANNADLDVRPRLVSLLEDKGFDRMELTTSDTHVVARVVNAQGYNPLGRRIPVGALLEKVDALADEALSNLEPVDVAWRESVVPRLRIWGDPSYFDNVVMPTLNRCVSTSKLLLTIGLVPPLFLSALFLAAFYEININWANFPYI